MSKVIILGAGSSKECGLPLGAEIWKYFEEVEDKSWYYFLKKIFSQFPELFLRFPHDQDKYPSFELVLSLIEYCTKTKLKFGEPSESLKDIKTSLINDYKKIFISKSLDLLIRFIEDEEPGMIETRENFDNWYYPFFKKEIEKEKGIVFISINYDILIDVVLIKLVKDEKIKDFTYGFDIYDLSGKKDKCKNQGILLLKPHGSINFSQCHSCKKVYYWIEEDDASEDKKRCACKGELNTLILPPGFINKNKPYSIIRKKLSKEISKAEDILIIGYALPDYDVDILHAFLKGARGNNRKTLNVKIIEQQGLTAFEDKKKKHEQEIKSKYETIFNRSVQYYGGGFKKYAEDFLAKLNKT